MEEATSEGRRRRGIYLLPNLFTTSALFAGFYAIVAAMKGHFDTAAIAIFTAMVMDSLDGRVARLTHTQSAFGAEYDSLSDVVSFGVAPALVAYSCGLSTLGKIGWLVAFFYTATTALRLARFNSRIEKDDKRYFSGLPCPAAAGVIAGLCGLGHELDMTGAALSGVTAFVVVIISCLMVSNFRFYSFKEVDFKGHVPFITVLAMLFIFVAVSVDPPKIIFSLLSLYALSGPFFEAVCFLKHYKKNRKR